MEEMKMKEESYNADNICGPQDETSVEEDPLQINEEEEVGIKEEPEPEFENNTFECKVEIEEEEDYAEETTKSEEGDVQSGTVQKYMLNSDLEFTSCGQQNCGMCKQKLFTYINDTVILTPNPPLLIKCVVCNKGFSYECQLQMHSQRNECQPSTQKQKTSHEHHTHRQKKEDCSKILENRVTYKCDVCDVEFFKKIRFVKHYADHVKNLTYLCEKCGKLFSKRHHFVRHVRAHAFLRPFECDVCKKCFSDINQLTVHIRRHMGKAPYECDLCKKTFRQKRMYNCHLRIHKIDHNNGLDGGD